MAYKISVVMPALNEEDNVVKAVENAREAFARAHIEGEIILVNDGSTDRTGALGEALAAKYSFLRVVRHETPEGIGKSFWDGVKLAQGEIVTLLPGDGENDGYEILRYLPLLDEVDIVVPFVFNRGSRSGLRRLVSKLYRAVINLTFGTSLNYMNGTVMYRRCLLDSLILRSHGFFYQTELLVRCLRAGYLYAEVPYALGMRAAGRSKALTWKNVKWVISDYLAAVASVRASSKAGAPLAAESVSAARRRQCAETEPPSRLVPRPRLSEGPLCP